MLDDLLATEPSVPMLERDDDDLAVLMFTSGTAGFPKAAMLTHGNLRSNIEQMQANEARVQTADDVSLGVLPLFHIFGLNVVLGLSLYAGSRVVLIERFDPTSALEAVQRHRVTILPGAPAMWTAWASPVRRTRRRVRIGAHRGVGRGEAPARRRRDLQAQVRRRDHGGLRAHRGVAGRDDVRGWTREAGLDRRAAAGCARAARRCRR